MNYSIEDVAEMPPNALVNLYLMASWMYYMKDETIVSDIVYDMCCLRLRETWDLIDHPHKKCIDYGSLTATTGFTLKEEDYPLMVRQAAMHFFEESR